ncbi:TPA: hypothetical protein HA238_01180 [Candidatus Micrarchaeota archaeon]|nr:hypothetical protein [Candidatus Micrarchaeota archaeon]
MDDVEVLSTIVGLLKKLEPDAQQRVLHSVQTFLAIPSQRDAHLPTHAKVLQSSFLSTSPTDFSRDRTLSPKEFIRDKHPVTDGDRVTCLAYYLTHYRETPHFKTVDISGLNTEAAQPKLSNPSAAVENATRDGYLVAGTKGNKQISSAGEKYVEMLPDREAATEALRSLRTRRAIKKRKPKTA